MTCKIMKMESESDTKLFSLKLRRNEDTREVTASRSSTKPWRRCFSPTLQLLHRTAAQEPMTKFRGLGQVTLDHLSVTQTVHPQINFLAHSQVCHVVLFKAVISHSVVLYAVSIFISQAVISPSVGAVMDYITEMQGQVTHCCSIFCQDDLCIIVHCCTCQDDICIIFHCCTFFLSG